MKVGEISNMIEAEEGYYVVQNVSEYDEAATRENIAYMVQQAKADFAAEQLERWIKETPLQLDEDLWETVKVDKMLTESSVFES